MSRSTPSMLGQIALVALVALVAMTAGCDPVSKSPDPVADMSHVADLSAPPMCTPKNCAGCCLNDVCQPGVNYTACGTAGAACVKCSDTQKCGTDFQCTTDPNISWLVAVTQATFSTTNPMSTPMSGMPWRTDSSLPQPLVQFDMFNRTSAKPIVVTGTAPNQTWTVTWAEGFAYAAKDLLSTGIDLQVFDQITGTTTQPMSAKKHVIFSQQDFTNKSLTYQNWEGVKTLTIILQRR